MALSPTQVEAIRSQLRKHRDRTIVSILCYVGVRPGTFADRRYLPSGNRTRPNVLASIIAEAA